MREVSITNSDLKFRVDDEDFDIVSKYKWHISNGYLSRCVSRKKSERLHRFLMRPPVGLVVDHIDGDPLNNQKSNLRVCTVKENVRNRHNKYRGVSRFKGVFKRQDALTWEARIRVDNKTIFLGSYMEESQAAIAYDIAAVKHFGEFASLNFPDRTSVDHPPKANAKAGRRHKNKFIGVQKNGNRWRAFFYNPEDKSLKHIKSCLTDIEAALAYDAYAKQVLKEKARLNFNEA